MTTMSKVQLNLAIPEQYRNLLRRMAAERMMSDPCRVITGSSLAAELLITTLQEITGETKEGVLNHD